MARSAFRVLLGLGAVLFGLAVILLEPFRDSIRQPFIANSTPEVYDGRQDIRYIGSRSSAGVEHFQNIFFAESTSGSNRFAPPVPYIPSPGSVVDASSPGAWCPQGTGDVLPFTSRITNVSENCLSLRIARPQGTKPDAKLPVMIWLHGGGHALGSAYEILYEPDGLVKQAAVDGQPLIFVAANYRLGFFGFATSESMAKNGFTNAGLRDQRAAFEWVRDNIENFGGDPQRVTAIGQSVGASDTSLQMTAFGGERGVPFQQAIMMSGAPGLNFNTKSDLVAKNTAAIAKEVGCITKNGDGQSEETLQCLQEAPVDILTNLSVTASRAARPPFGEGFFYPIYDNDFLPDRPSELVRAGNVVKDIPIIASWVTNDGAWYAPPTTSTDEDVLASFGLWLTGLSAATKKQLLSLYPLSAFEHMVRPDLDGPISPQYYRAAQLNRDLWFTCPVLDFAWQYARHNGGNVRLYEHNATRFGPVFEKVMGVPMWRVSHLSDIPYVLNVQQVGAGADNSAAQLEVSRAVSRRIAKFVSTGDTGGGWPLAFSGTTGEDLAAKFPKKMALQLFGGPYEGQAVSLQRDKMLGDRLDADNAVLWERLFERCEFINSAEVRQEIGV